MAITFKDNNTKEPVLTRKIYDLLIFAYRFGYEHGVRVADSDFNEFQLGIFEMLNTYFEKDDNGQK